MLILSQWNGNLRNSACFSFKMMRNVHPTVTDVTIIYKETKPLELGVGSNLASCF